MTESELKWLRQYFRDTYNEDFCSSYQLELIGEVPAGVLEWAGILLDDVAPIRRPLLHIVAPATPAVARRRSSPR